jgi:hypothetical protein
VFGLGKGSVTVSIQKFSYLPGDTISGSVSLTVKKPVKAREMSISLIGERKVTRRVKSSSGSGTTTQVQTTRVYDFKQPLDGEKEYTGPADYPFQIKIPADILGISSPPQMPDMPDGLATGIKIAQQFAAMTGAMPASHTKWFLLAKLDIPGGMDISKTADITLG